MKILLSWLREFVDVPSTADEIARTMSVRGFAVEGIEPRGGLSAEVPALSDLSAEASAKADAVIDFEVTANRPDCMSVIGMAREIAAAFDRPLREELSLASLHHAPKSDIAVAIERPDLCPRYAAAVADVSIAPSPPWLQERLRASGIRPISNIVDITNYVLLELGHPMHAFDLATLAGNEIRVRTAQPGESLRMLDGQVRSLGPEMLVIADAAKPAAVAGVMGGADSEVTGSTRAIVLESAYFDPSSVRRTSKKLGVKTEASMRFERGADPELPAIAMARACALLESSGAGRSRGTIVDEYPRRPEPRRLHLRRDRLAGLLGIRVPDADVRRILERLGLGIEESTGEGWTVRVPSRRVDVLREVDLIEEVARHFGFDRIPVRFPPLSAPAPPPDPRIGQARTLRNVLTAAGFSEAVTFGFIDEISATQFAASEELVPIANPLSETFGVLRPSILPGLIAAVGHNRRREQRDIRLFEIGARFLRPSGERRAVACAWTGAAVAEHWGGGARPVDFFDIKGVAEALCRTLRIEPATTTHRERWLVPGRSAAIRHNGTVLGLFGQLAPEIGQAHGVPIADPVFVAEVDLDAAEAVAASPRIDIDPLPRYPSITRDIAILVDQAVSADRLRHTIHTAGTSLLVRIREFDRYQGKGIPESKCSLALHLTFRSSDRTLTDAEVDAAMERIIDALKQEHDAIRR